MFRQSKFIKVPFLPAIGYFRATILNIKKQQQQNLPKHPFITMVRTITALEIEFQIKFRGEL